MQNLWASTILPIASMDGTSNKNVVCHKHLTGCLYVKQKLSLFQTSHLQIVAITPDIQGNLTTGIKGLKNRRTTWECLPKM